MERTVNDPLALTHVTGKKAVEIVTIPPLGRKALSLRNSEQTPRQFLEALLKEGLYSDAIRFLVFALPKREAIWWAALYVLWSGAGHLHSEDARVLQAVSRWVLEPTEQRRQEAAKWASKKTAAERVAAAVANTGGSIRPASLPSKPPTPAMVSQAVSSAITLACLQGESKQLPQRQRQAVALGTYVARGRFLWTLPAPSNSRR